MRPKHILLSAIFLFAVPLFASAEVKVAFLELKNYHGDPVILEDGGRFAHLAVEVEGLWLHSKPLKGVVLETMEDLKKMGEVTEILISRRRSSLKISEIRHLIGLSYDSEYRWSNDAYYCSELVGKLLGLKPRPMEFSLNLWPEKYRSKNKLPGLSPDEVFRLVEVEKQFPRCR